VKHPVRRRLAAQESLEQIAVRIAEQDLEAAYRFVDAVEASLALLSEMPEAGPRYETENTVLAGRIRKWVVPRYRGSCERLGMVGATRIGRAFAVALVLAIPSSSSVTIATFPVRWPRFPCSRNQGIPPVPGREGVETDGWTSRASPVSRNFPVLSL
jgi:plasmid stabilization system protein ParE